MTNIKIYNGKKLAKELFLQAWALDYMVYDTQYQMTCAECAAFFEKNPQIYFIAVDETVQKVVGYFNFCPISKELADKIKSGHFLDSNMTAEDVQIYKDNHEYCGYMASLVIHPAYQRQGIANTLIEAWQEFLKTMSLSRGITFTELLADAVSPGGEYLLKKMGFSLLCETEHGTKIMYKLNK